MGKFVRQLTIIYYVIFISFFAVYGIMWYFVNKMLGGPIVEFGTTLATALQTIGILWVIASVPFALWIFSRRTKTINRDLPEAEKMAIYRKWFILQLILIGIGVILCIIFAVIIGDRSMVYCAMCAAVAYIFCRPNRNKIEYDLTLIQDVDEKDCY